MIRFAVYFLTLKDDSVKLVTLNDILGHHQSAFLP